MVIFAKLFGRLRTKRQGRAAFSGTSSNLPSGAVCAYASASRSLRCGEPDSRQNNDHAGDGPREVFHGIRSFRPARRLHLDERRVRQMGGRQDPRAHPWPALCQRRVRGRARLWRRDLQADRAYRAAARIGAAARLQDSLQRRRDRRRLPQAAEEAGLHRRLCPADRLARQRADGRVGAEQPHQLRHRHLAVAELFRPGAEAEGHPPRHRRVAPPRSAHRAVEVQGGRPLHDLHACPSMRPKPRAMPTR